MRVTTWRYESATFGLDSQWSMGKYNVFVMFFIKLVNLLNELVNVSHEQNLMYIKFYTDAKLFLRERDGRVVMVLNSR